VSGFGLIFLLVGVAGLVGGIFTLVRTRSFLASAREAQARVVGMKERIGTERQVAYYPVLRYQTHQGSVKEIVSSVGSNPPRYKEGDSVVILYDPAKPESARIHTFFNVWGVPLILGGMGFLFLIVSGIVVAVSGR
jgi:Protein of unknown function (DUF3592)